MSPIDAPALPPHWLQILLALADGQRHGLGIMNEVLELTGGRMRLWPAMLYRSLQRLAEEGLIAEISPPAPQPGNPRYFRITAAGRRACAAEARRLDGIVKTAMAKRLLSERPRPERGASDSESPSEREWGWGPIRRKKT